MFFGTEIFRFQMFLSLGTIAFFWQKRGVRIPLLFPGAFFSLILLSSLQAAGGGTGREPRPIEIAPQINQPLSASELKSSAKAIFQRVIQARLFHSGTWTLAGSSQTPTTAARTITSLQPTFVTGLLRLSDRGEISNAEMEGFTTVRNEVRIANKSCRFDVVMNATDEDSAESFVRRMTEINRHLHPDAWTLSVRPDEETIRADLFEKAIAYAHSLKEMVGYDGPLSLIPEGVDYIIVRAAGFQLSRKQLDLLRTKQRVPLIVELPTASGSSPNHDVSVFVEEMSTVERGVALTHLAENQNSWGYHFAYPIFYPLYPTNHAFDATKDNILLVTIRSLLTRFN